MTPTPTNDHKVTPTPTNDTKVADKVTPPPVDDKPKGVGTLMLGSKPPCEIFIDGSDQGFTTPHKIEKLSAGKHRITLVNNEFGIKETFAVDIKADAVEKQIKDYSERRSARRARTSCAEDSRKRNRRRVVGVIAIARREPAR